MPHYHEAEVALPKCFQVVASVGHQGNWCARVKIEGAERPQYLGRRQPFIVSAILLVRTQTHLNPLPVWRNPSLQRDLAKSRQAPELVRYAS